MKKLLIAGLVCMLGGCASRAPEPAGYTPQAADSEVHTRARIHAELAAGYLELGNYGVALQEANEALKSDANYVPAHNVLGLAYMELRDDKSAEASFQRALRINALDSDSNNNYGWFLCQRKREKESVKYFLDALRNPLYATPEKSWVNAGICARQAGDQANAEDYFQRAIKLRPNQPQALQQLADMAFRRRDFVGAKTYLSRVQRDAGSPSAEFLWLALRVERSLGDRNAEQSLSFQLQKNFPESREARALAAGKYE
ncbi:MAG: type IV pilus biogenesis/stability protein PilW [Betaproteobacteria bacterium]|nr:type IV pilus biogenesis/stability protein PilW [Betaproteobacteria bacterium]